MSSVVISGDTSGAITLSAPAVAGTNTITLPAATGTAVITGTTPTLNGITFPATQVPSADANTLDDYEEGTWTPVLKNSGGTQVSNNSSLVGYTKIGNQVTVSTHISLSATLTSGNFTVEGLPFTSSNNVRGCGSCSFVALGTGVNTPQVINISSGTAILSGYSSVSLVSNDRVNITVTYFV